MNNTVWHKSIDGIEYQIRQVDEDDCIVEKKAVNGMWYPADDEDASHVYMTAFLGLRNVIKSTASTLEASLES